MPNPALVSSSTARYNRLNIFSGVAIVGTMSTDRVTSSLALVTNLILVDCRVLGVEVPPNAEIDMFHW